MRGKNHDFDTESLYKFIRDHFQTRNINYTAVEAPEADVRDNCLFIHFYQSKFFTYGRRQRVLHFCFKTTE